MRPAVAGTYMGSRPPLRPPVFPFARSTQVPHVPRRPGEAPMPLPLPSGPRVIPSIRGLFRRLTSKPPQASLIKFLSQVTQQSHQHVHDFRAASSNPTTVASWSKSDVLVPTETLFLTTPPRAEVQRRSQPLKTSQSKNIAPVFRPINIHENQCNNQYKNQPEWSLPLLLLTRLSGSK